MGDLDERNGFAVKFHSDRTIKLFHHTEALAFEGEGGFLDPEGSTLPTNRVIPGDKTRLFEAEDILQTESLGDATVKVFLGQRDPAKLLIKPSQIGFEESIGRILRADPC